MQSSRMKSLFLLSTLAAGLLIAPRPADAHCDTLDGPVVADAKKALAAGSVTPVLKWVRPADEAAIRAAFEKTVSVRKLSAEARDLADTAFFETLVRVHRAGEGAPFTGLKPAGSMEPIYRHADEALAEGTVDPLLAELTQEVSHGLKERFTHARALKAAAGDDVTKGREAVAAYVDYLHYVEELHGAIKGESHHAD